jgi:DNA invertase Pin-like site-specific DNA recombinase
MKAAIYVRVSTTSQDLSPVAQEDQARLFCQMRGYEVGQVFAEIGVSGGAKFAARPVGSQLVARLEEFDVVVFTKLDRAFRSTVDCITTVDRFREAGKVIVFLDLNIDTSNPAGGLCLQMMAALAEFERRRTGERIRESLRVVKEQGRKVGAAPYGYRNRARLQNGRKVDGGLHEPVPSEQAVIDRIIRRRAEKARLVDIAAELQRDKVPTRRGGTWSPEHVRKILARQA